MNSQSLYRPSASGGGRCPAADSAERRPPQPPSMPAHDASEPEPKRTVGLAWSATANNRVKIGLLNRTAQQLVPTLDLCCGLRTRCAGRNRQAPLPLVPVGYGVHQELGRHVL